MPKETTTTAKATRRPRGAPRLLALEAARTLFARQDYRNTTTKEIAEAAGIARAPAVPALRVEGRAVQRGGRRAVPRDRRRPQRPVGVDRARPGTAPRRSAASSSARSTTSSSRTAAGDDAVGSRRADRRGAGRDRHRRHRPGDRRPRRPRRRRAATSWASTPTTRTWPPARRWRWSPGWPRSARPSSAGRARPATSSSRRSPRRRCTGSSHPGDRDT